MTRFNSSPWCCSFKVLFVSHVIHTHTHTFICHLPTLSGWLLCVSYNQHILILPSCDGNNTGQLHFVMDTVAYKPRKVLFIFHFLDELPGSLRQSHHRVKSSVGFKIWPGLAPSSGSITGLHCPSSSTSGDCELPCGVVSGLNVAVVAYGGSLWMEGGS